MFTAKDFLDKAKKNKSQNENELLKDKSKAAMTGLAIGGIARFICRLYKKVQYFDKRVFGWTHW